jgi:hypothetical protein
MIILNWHVIADLPLIAENYQEAGHCQLRNWIYNRIISIIISEEKVLLGEADRFHEEQKFIGHAGVVCRYLFSGWWVGGAFYIQSGARLVSNDQQAFLESSWVFGPVWTILYLMMWPAVAGSPPPVFSSVIRYCGFERFFS